MRCLCVCGYKFECICVFACIKLLISFICVQAYREGGVGVSYPGPAMFGGPAVGQKYIVRQNVPFLKRKMYHFWKEKIKINSPEGPRENVWGPHENVSPGPTVAVDRPVCVDGTMAYRGRVFVSADGGSLRWFFPPLPKSALALPGENRTSKILLHFCFCWMPYNYLSHCYSIACDRLQNNFRHTVILSFRL